MKDLLRKTYHRARWDLERFFLRRRTAREDLLRHSPGDRPRVLFFLPEVSVTPHFAATCILARALKDKGYEPVFVRCFEGFPRCSVMDMLGLSVTGDAMRKRQACHACVGQSFDLLGRYGLEAVDLRSLLDREMLATARQARTMPAEALGSFEWDGVAFGKVAAANVAVIMKLSDLDAPSAETVAAWRQHLESSLITYMATRELLKRVEVRSVVHFNDYSMPLAVRAAAKQRGIPAISLSQPGHRNVDRTKIMLQPHIWGVTKLLQGDAWPQWRELSLPAERVKEIADDLFVRMRGRGAHTYSPRKEHDTESVRGRLSLSSHKKTVVAFTSSLDEFRATRLSYEASGVPVPPARMPFGDQIGWLTKLVETFEARADAQLVVRIHPREGANRRDGVNSQHLALLKERFSADYVNCRFIWPGVPVSSYDLMEIADLGLVSWSSTAMELARFGVPVLAATFNVMSYPNEDFLQFVDSPEGHLQGIFDRLAKPGTSLDTIIGAYRCYNLLWLGTSVSVADVVPHVDYFDFPEYRPPAEAPLIEAVLGRGASMLELNHERLAAAQAPGGPAKERAALAAQLRRLIHFFHTGEEPSDPPSLGTVVVPASELARASFVPEPGTAILAMADQRTRYFTAGKSYERFSPLCARLAPLCAEPLASTSFMKLTG